MTGGFVIAGHALVPCWEPVRPVSKRRLEAEGKAECFTGG
jgi:hypothetical protein